jgi:hypothetical protein
MPLPPYPLVPAPQTWSKGPILTSALRGDVANAVTFLANKPSFLGQCTSAPAIATGGTGQQVTLDTGLYDNWQGHQPLGAEPQWYFCQAPGWYLVEGFTGWNYVTATAATFTTSLGVGLVGGLTVYPGEQHTVANTRPPGPFAAELFLLQRTGLPGAAGIDYVTLLGRQNSGGALNLIASAGMYPRLSVRWVAAASGSAGLPIPANPAWPVPPAYVTSAFLNANIRDTIRYLTYPPILRMTYHAGTANLASTTFPAGTTIPMDTTTIDNYSGWSAANNWYAAPRAGVYYCYGQVAVAPFGAVGDAAAGLTVNSGTTIWGQAVRSPATAGSGPQAGICKRLRLNAGDTVALTGQQSSGAAVTLTGDANKLIMVWESS